MPNRRPDKGHVRCLETYILKHDREKNLEIMANIFQTFPNGQRTLIYTTKYPTIYDLTLQYHTHKKQPS